MVRWGEFFYKESEGTIRYILVNDRATLEWLGTLANLEIHPLLHRVPRIDRPTTIVFDLGGADFLTCGRVALLLRDLLDDPGLRSFVEVSGSKGLQIYVPLNREVTFSKECRLLSKALKPDLTRRGNELEIKRQDATRFAA